MKREIVNRIRYILEEWLPPALRDSAPMRVVFRGYWGRLVDDLERFRANITSLSPADYDGVYRRMPRIQDETDNSRACLDAVSSRVVGESVCDVGCGTGYLLNYLKTHRAADRLQLTGVDFIIEEATGVRDGSIRFIAAPIEQLPFPDRHFDTVICTHVLEHILDIRKAIAELRRITRRRLIIVVPLEREYRFTFNPHIHFFPYPHSFLRVAIPIPRDRELVTIGRDLLYVEEHADDTVTRSPAS